LSAQKLKEGRFPPLNRKSWVIREKIPFRMIKEKNPLPHSLVDQNPCMMVLFGIGSWMTLEDTIK
jgi:hypothetical protein